MEIFNFLKKKKKIFNNETLKKAVEIWLKNPDKAEKKYGHISKWDTSEVTNMSKLFQFSDFNQPIGDWDVSKVTNMGEIFCYAKSFNQPIGDWDVGKVKNMYRFFSGAKRFNRPIGNWNVSRVTNTNEMFSETQSFNRLLGDWDFSSVTNMKDMFNGAKSFNKPIGDWKVSSVKDMGSMFREAISFNQPIGDWDVSSVINMKDMFNGAKSFNQPIGGWDTSSVIYMSTPSLPPFMNLKKKVLSINSPYNVPDADTVTDMNGMFAGAISFNQPIGDWDVSNVTDMNGMFAGAISFNQPIGDWDVSNVEYMESMFSGAKSFNQPIGGWDVRNVRQMSGMFQKAISFNQLIDEFIKDGWKGSAQIDQMVFSRRRRPVVIKSNIFLGAHKNMIFRYGINGSEINEKETDSSLHKNLPNFNDTRSYFRISENSYGQGMIIKVKFNKGIHQDYSFIYNHDEVYDNTINHLRTLMCWKNDNSYSSATSIPSWAKLYIYE